LFIFSPQYLANSEQLINDFSFFFFLLTHDQGKHYHPKLNTMEHESTASQNDSRMNECNTNFQLFRIANKIFLYLAPIYLFSPYFSIPSPHRLFSLKYISKYYILSHHWVLHFLFSLPKFSFTFSLLVMLPL
jgi:hypothetical protein